MAVTPGINRIFRCESMRLRRRITIRTTNATTAVNSTPDRTPMAILSDTPNMGPKDSMFLRAESCTSSGTAPSTSGNVGPSVGSAGASSVSNRNIGSILTTRSELNLETATLTVMLHLTDLRNTTYDPATVMPRAKLEVSDASAIVEPIIDKVKKGGAEAVLELTEQFDRVRPASLRVPAAALDQALDELSEDVRAALEE